MMLLNKARLAAVISASLLAATVAPVAQAEGHRLDRTVVYITRHAEKQNVLDDQENSICKADLSRCEEELSALGELRAELLAEWLERRGILYGITDVISSDKQRTRQTVEPTADKLLDLHVNLLADDVMDGIADGVRQVPAEKVGVAGNELSGNSGSVGPTVDAIKQLAPGSVALVAAHSGTIYRILGGEDEDGNAHTGDDTSVGLGVDTTVGDVRAEITLFPKRPEDDKVPTFGDLWKVIINNNTGEARVAWRKNLQPQSLMLENQTLNRGTHLENRYW